MRPAGGLREACGYAQVTSNRIGSNVETEVFDPAVKVRTFKKTDERCEVIGCHRPWLTNSGRVSPCRLHAIKYSPATQRLYVIPRLADYCRCDIPGEPDVGIQCAA